MLSDKVIRALREMVKTLVDIDPAFAKVDAALGERQTLRERNVRYGVEIEAGKAEINRLRMVLREHGLTDYAEVEAEAPEQVEERKARVQKALFAKPLPVHEYVAFTCPDPSCGATVRNGQCANGHAITVEMV